MRIFGYISRNSATGWDMSIKSPSGSYGNLPTSSELFEILRQASELILSEKPEGKICGSDKTFKVWKDDEGNRSVTVPLVGVTFYLRENKNPARRSAVTFTMVTDFQFRHELEPQEVL